MRSARVFIAYRTRRNTCRRTSRKFSMTGRASIIELTPNRSDHSNEPVRFTQTPSPSPGGQVSEMAGGPHHAHLRGWLPHGGPGELDVSGHRCRRGLPRSAARSGWAKSTRCRTSAPGIGQVPGTDPVQLRPDPARYSMALNDTKPARQRRVVPVVPASSRFTNYRHTLTQRQLDLTRQLIVANLD